MEFRNDPKDSRLAQIVQLLGERDRARPASLLTRADPPPMLPGVYSWWADEEARRTIGRVLGILAPELIYVGKAGGGSSAATLASRILGNHLGTALGRSTLRRTTTAILGAAQAPRLDAVTVFPAAEEVSTWMRAHLFVATVPVEEAALVRSAEHVALSRYDPVLNLDGMPRSEARARLTRLRRALRDSIR